MSVISDLRQRYPNLSGYTDDDIIGMVAASNNVKADSKDYDSLRGYMGGYDRTWGQFAGDVAVGVGKGVAAIGTGLGELGGALLPGVSAFDNPVVNASRAASDKLDTMRSEGSLNQQAAADQDLRVRAAQSKAQGDGDLQTATAELGTFLKNLVKYPATSTELVAEQVPQLGFGKLLGLGGRAAGAMSGLGEMGAARAGTGAVVAGMAGQQGGQAGQMAYDELVKRGVDPDEAARQAGVAAAQAAPVSAGLMLLPGARNLPKALSGEAITSSGSRVGTILRSAAAEAGAQGADQGFTQFASNRSIHDTDPTYDVTTGLGTAVGMGGVMGLATGGAGGAMVRLQPRTETGEIDLTKSPEASPADGTPPTDAAPGGPTAQNAVRLPVDVDRPAALRKAQVQGPVQSSDTSQLALPAPAPGPLQIGYTPPTMFVDPTGAAQPGAMPTEQEVAQRKLAPQPVDRRPPLIEQPAQPGAQPTQPAPLMATQDGTVMPWQTPEQLAGMDAARQAQTSGAQQRVTRGDLLKIIQSLKGAYVRKDGNLANTRGGLAMRNILEADDPATATREAYQNGGGDRDELLDALHQRLTGQTIDQFNASTQTPAAQPASADTLPTNSAGFVPEPIADIQAQIAAVKAKKKPAIVLGVEEAAQVNPAGLARTTVTDPNTGDSAVVMTRTKRELSPIQKRVNEVGLKHAMGELLGVSNPELTTARPTGAPVAVAQQTDPATGAVVSEELVTPADVPNVKRVPDTTLHVVPVADAMARRLDAQAARAPAQEINTVNPEVTPAKAPRLGREPADKVVDLANTTKDETEFNTAEDELYHRWVDMGDEAAENYFLEGMRPVAGKSGVNAYRTTPHGQELQARYEQVRDAKGVRDGQELGKKFGATLREPTKDIYDGIEQRPDTTAKQRSLGRDAIADLERAVRESDHEAPLGNGSRNAQRPNDGRAVSASTQSDVAGRGRSGAGREPRDAVADLEEIVREADSAGGEPRSSVRTGERGDDLGGGTRDRPGVSSQTRNDSRGTGGSKVGDKVVPRRLRDVVHLLGQRLADNFKAGHPNQLVGQRIRSAADLAELAQVYRDPRFETFRVVYTDASGNVVGEAGYSSRLPSMVVAPKGLAKLVGADVARFQASGYYLMHNHPDGRAEPSPDDVKTTTGLARSVPGMIGHVIIDHNEYAEITPSGRATIVAAPHLNGVDFTAHPAVSHPLLGQQILSRDAVASMAKALQTPNGHATLVLTDANGDVQLLADFPMAVLADSSPAGAVKAGAAVRRAMRASGAGGDRFVVVPSAADISPALQRLVLQGVFTGAISADGHRLLRPRNQYDPFEYAAGYRVPEPSSGSDSVREVKRSIETHPALAGIAEAPHRAEVAAGDVRGKELSGKLLSVMTLNQIVEHFGKKLPGLHEFVEAVQERGSHATRLPMRADRLVRRWQGAVHNKADAAAFNDILLRASQSELSLDNTSPEYVGRLSPEDRAEYVALRAKLAALSPELQAVRREALDVLHDQWEFTRSALRKFIEHTIPDAPTREARLKQLDTEMGRNRGDYFPLSRFGDRVVIGVGAAKDGRDAVSFHESAKSAEAERKRLQAAGVKKIIMNLTTDRDPRQRPSTGFMADLHREIEQADMPAEVREELQQNLQQLYMKSLPELSGAKHMMRRENVEGFSTDALRVFADAVTRGAHYASQLEYAPRIQAATESMELQSRSSDTRSAAVVVGRKDDGPAQVQVTSPGSDRYKAVEKLMGDGYKVEFFNTVPENVHETVGAHLPELTEAQLAHVKDQVQALVGRDTEGVEDLRGAKALYNHMIALQKASRTDRGAIDHIIDVLGQVGYTWFLGFTPAFWTMNLLQNPMIGIPHLGARYGVVKSAMAMGNAARWFAGVRIGKLIKDAKEPFSIEWLRKQNLRGVGKKELDMLQFLEDHQALDFTQAMDLGRIGQNSNSAWTRAMRLAAAGAHHTEVFNRVTFALANYRLAKEAGATHEQAVAAALDGVRKVHFDYTSENKPLAMRGRAMRLVLQFQQYRQHMLAWWAGTVKDMFKGETPEVRHRGYKAAFLMGTTHAIFAGALGMPFIGTVAMLANMFAPDDDDGVPFDFSRWVTEAATEATGSDKAGQVMAHGIFTALNMDIGKRIGQADLLPLLNEGSWKYERTAKDKMTSVLVDALGPLGSIVVTGASSADAFARGDVMQGLGLVTPKAISDVLKSVQLANKGLVNSQGKVLATEEAFDGADVFLQAAGVYPSSVARIKQDKGAILDIEDGIKDRAKRLSGAFVDAWARGDREAVSDAVDDIKTYNQKVGTGRLRAVPGAVITGRSLESAIRDRQQRALILAATAGTAETKRQLMIALSMSGLLGPDTTSAMADSGLALPSLPGVNQ